MKINEGDKVGVISNGEIKKGVVISVYNDLDYAIVKMENKTIKVMLHNLGLLPEEEKPIPKTEITITRDEFRNKAVKLISDEARKTCSGMVGIALSLFTSDLERSLFDEGDND